MEPARALALNGALIGRDILEWRGPRFDACKASDVVMPISTIGTATIKFTNGNSAEFTYTTDGSTGPPAVSSPRDRAPKSIVRFPMTAGGAVCQ